MTDLAMKQAKVDKAYFSKENITFDLAFSSSLERCCDTLEIITDQPYIRLKGLKEMYFGKFEGESEFLHPKFPFHDWYKNHGGGESEEEVGLCIDKTLRDICKNYDFDTALAVSHGAACHSFIELHKDTNLVNIEGRIPNCTIFKVIYDDDVFRCVEIIRHDFTGIEV